MEHLVFVQIQKLHVDYHLSVFIVKIILLRKTVNEVFFLVSCTMVLNSQCHEMVADVVQEYVTT